MPLYEGQVNVNHPKGDPLAHDYQDRLGVIRHVTVQADGLFADLHFNRSTPWPAVDLGRRACAGERRVFPQCSGPHGGGQRLVVRRSQSAKRRPGRRPATTRGLFEAAAQTLERGGRGRAKNVAAENRDNAGPSGLASLTLEELRRSRPDLVDELLRQQAASSPPGSRSWIGSGPWSGARNGRPSSDSWPSSIFPTPTRKPPLPARS